MTSVDPRRSGSAPLWADAFPRLFEIYAASNQASPGNWVQQPNVWRGVRGFLETVSFVLYGQAQRGNEQHAQAFSDWTLCAERQPLSRWRTLAWGLGELNKTAAGQFSISRRSRAKIRRTRATRNCAPFGS